MFNLYSFDKHIFFLITLIAIAIIQNKMEMYSFAYTPKLLESGKQS